MRSPLPQARYAAMTETLNSQLTLSDTMITTDMVEKLVEPRHRRPRRGHAVPQPSGDHPMLGYSERDWIEAFVGAMAVLSAFLLWVC